MPEELVDDTGTLSSDIVFSEDAPDGIPVLAQALWFGVRPGYDGNGRRLAEPTIWVQYQERHMASQLTGMVAVSPESWDRINEAVQWRIAEWRRISEDEHGAHPDGDAAAGSIPAEGMLASGEPRQAGGDTGNGGEVMHPDHGTSSRS